MLTLQKNAQKTVKPTVHDVYATKDSLVTEVRAQHARHVMFAPQSTAHAMARTRPTRSHVDATQATTGTAWSARLALAIAASLGSHRTVQRTAPQMCRTVRATLASMAMERRAQHAGHVMRTPQSTAHAMALTCRTRSHVNAMQATTGTALSARLALAIAASLGSHRTVQRTAPQMCQNVHAMQASTATEVRAQRASHVTVMYTPQSTVHAMAWTCRTRSHVNATQATTGTARSARHALAIAASLTLQ
jgi:hypothetical protein